jgi:hypothetical protein
MKFPVRKMYTLGPWSHTRRGTVYLDVYIVSWLCFLALEQDFLARYSEALIARIS